MRLIAGFYHICSVVFGFMQRLSSAIAFLMKMFVLNTNDSDFFLTSIKTVQFYVLFLLLFSLVKKKIFYISL